MKSQKLSVSQTTLWRRARQEISRPFPDGVELKNNFYWILLQKL
jgi:hypothetical protein